MKSVKKWLEAALLPLLLLLLTATAFAVDHGYGYWQLTDNQKYLYDMMAEPIAAGESRIELDPSRQITEADTQMAMTIFAADYPGYSWFGVKDGERMYYLDIQTWGDTVLTLMPCYNSRDISRCRSALQNAAQTAINAIPASAQSQYDKALFLHDYLAQQVNYSYGTTDNMTAYGALVNGSAGCVGYAKAYQYLLQQAGIEAWTLVGTATNSNGTGNHAWNAAHLDGNWYYIDVTWDDTNSGIIYRYFGLSLSAISADHTLEAPYSYMRPNSEITVPPTAEQSPAEPAVEELPSPPPESVPEDPVEETVTETDLPDVTVTATDLEEEAVEATEIEKTAETSAVLWGAIAAAVAAIAVFAWLARRGKKRKEDGSSCRTD